MSECVWGRGRLTMCMHVSFCLSLWVPCVILVSLVSLCGGGGVCQPVRVMSGESHEDEPGFSGN